MDAEVAKFCRMACRMLGLLWLGYGCKCGFCGQKRGDAMFFTFVFTVLYPPINKAEESLIYEIKQILFSYCSRLYYLCAEKFIDNEAKYFIPCRYFFYGFALYDEGWQRGRGVRGAR